MRKLLSTCFAATMCSFAIASASTAAAEVVVPTLICADGKGNYEDEFGNTHVLDKKGNLKGPLITVYKKADGSYYATLNKDGSRSKNVYPFEFDGDQCYMRVVEN